MLRVVEGSCSDSRLEVRDATDTAAFQDLTLAAAGRKVFLADSDHMRWVVVGSASDAWDDRDRAGSKANSRSAEVEYSMGLVAPMSDVRSKVQELLCCMAEAGWAHECSRVSP